MVTQLLQRMVFAVAGLHEEFAGLTTVVQRLRTDPREVERQQRQDGAAWLAWRQRHARVPACEMEAAGQLTLFPLPVMPHWASEQGFSLAGMQIRV